MRSRVLKRAKLIQKQIYLAEGITRDAIPIESLFRFLINYDQTFICSFNLLDSR